MDLKIDHWRELYTGDLKLYSELSHLKGIDEFGF